jgi:hypothetical protein
VVQIPKFDGSTSWAVFRRYFEIIAEHNGWTLSDKALYESIAHVLQSVLIGTKCEEVAAVLENSYRDHHLAEGFHGQLRRMVQHAGESLEESAATIGHLAHCSYVDSTEQHSRKGTALAFTDRLRERENVT